MVGEVDLLRWKLRCFSEKIGSLLNNIAYTCKHKYTPANILEPAWSHVKSNGKKQSWFK
jgi:hypothetical protein